MSDSLVLGRSSPSRTHHRPPHTKAKGEMKMTMQEEAEQIVEEGYCDGCSAIGCVDRSICDGFKAEVNRILNEWATEDAAEQLKWH